jgi:hypothetical protein
VTAELITNEERAAPPPPGSLLGRPDVRLGLLTLAALLAEAAVARWVLDTELPFFALLAPFWVFVAYRVSGQRGRTARIVASLGIVGAAVVVLVAYAL